MASESTQKIIQFLVRSYGVPKSYQDIMDATGTQKIAVGGTIHRMMEKGYLTESFRGETKLFELNEYGLLEQGE